MVSDTVHSAALEGNLYGDSPNRAVLVYLPAGYDGSPARRYSVVYLLHGFGALEGLWTGSNRVQTRMDSLTTVGSVHEMIIVTPHVQNVRGRNMYIDSPATANCEGFIARRTTRSPCSSGERWSQETTVPMSWHSAPTTPGIVGRPGSRRPHADRTSWGEQWMDVVAVNSLPLDPTGTNTVTIVR